MWVIRRAKRRGYQGWWLPARATLDDGDRYARRALCGWGWAVDKWRGRFGDCQMARLYLVAEPHQTLNVVRLADLAPGVALMLGIDVHGRARESPIPCGLFVGETFITRPSSDILTGILVCCRSEEFFTRRQAAYGTAAARGSLVGNGW